MRPPRLLVIQHNLDDHLNELAAAFVGEVRSFAGDR
jgi:hypothetical protein